MSDSQPATEGRIVHVRTPGVPHCQPAIVVRNWGGLEPCALNLLVFRDGSNDAAHPGEQWGDLVSWATSVPHGEQPDEQRRTWHWPERT